MVIILTINPLFSLNIVAELVYLGLKCRVAVRLLLLVMSVKFVSEQSALSVSTLSVWREQKYPGRQRYKYQALRVEYHFMENYKFAENIFAPSLRYGETAV